MNLIAIFLLVVNSFPQSVLEPEELAKFYPLVMEEATKEFVLQNDGRTQRNTREYG